MVEVTVSSTAATPPSTTVHTTPSTTVPATPTTTVPTSATTTTLPTQRRLQLGDQGEAVTSLQVRLQELGYWAGEVDGGFDSDTEHAVIALQKVTGIERDGIVGPDTYTALEEGVRPSPRSKQGLVVEIDLRRQIMMVVRDGSLEYLFDTSTGRLPGTTPAGTWSVTREIDGPHLSPLGLLYRPKYFHRGVAIHGYTSVPSYPASHGCVRVTYPTMDFIWDEDLVPVGTPVWVY